MVARAICGGYTGGAVWTGGRGSRHGHTVLGLGGWVGRRNRRIPPDDRFWAVAASAGERSTAVHPVTGREADGAVHADGQGNGDRQNDSPCCAGGHLAMQEGWVKDLVMHDVKAARAKDAPRAEAVGDSELAAVRCWLRSCCQLLLVMVSPTSLQHTHTH